MHLAVNTHAAHLLPHHQQLPSPHTHVSPKHSLHDVQPHLHHLQNLQTLLIGAYLTPSISIQDQTGFFGYGYSCNYQKYVYSSTVSIDRTELKHELFKV